MDRTYWKSQLVGFVCFGMGNYAQRVHVAICLKVGIWEPLWALSIYHIPTWTLWDEMIASWSRLEVDARFA